MKLTIASVALLLMSGAVLDSAHADNLKTCLTETADPTKDYFPDKVVPNFSKLWSISYHNTYKILKNLDEGSSYILYQCGTEPPSGIEANLTIPVPLQGGVALSTTVHISHFELLGLRDELKAYIGDPKWISSPCMNDRIASGETINVQYPDLDGALEGLLNTTGPELVLLYNPGMDVAPFANYVATSEWKERNNHGIGEWHKFYASFYNLEAQANKDIDEIIKNYECTSINANKVLSDVEVKPVVVFAEFSTFCGGWSVGSCPNFYCDHVNDCGAMMLEDQLTGSVVNPECGVEFPYMTTDEFVNFAKDADVWIYPGHGDYYWDTAYADFGEKLDEMKAVKNKQVFDTVLTGLNTWYEYRLVEYGESLFLQSLLPPQTSLTLYLNNYLDADVVLEDMCTIVGAGHPLFPHKRVFFRNVFQEDVGDLGQCVDPAIGYFRRDDACTELAVLNDISSAESFGFGLGMLANAILALSALIY